MKRNFPRAREERNANYEVKRNTDPTILPCDGAEESATFNADDKATSSPEVNDLAQLVWKYFREELRETLIEVQEAIQAEQKQ